MGLTDKFKNWKKEHNAKFHDQSNESRLQTKVDNKDILSCLSNKRKINSFSYDFKKDSYKILFPKLKLINFLSLITFTLLLICSLVMMGLSRNFNIINPNYIDPREYTSINTGSWIATFSDHCFTCMFFIIYTIYKVIVVAKRDAKFLNNDIYKYSFTNNVVIFILLSCLFILVFISFKPLSFLPMLVLQCTTYNGTLGKVFFIIIFVFQMLEIFCYLLYFSTCISCYAIKPKFNYDKMLSIN